MKTTTKFFTLLSLVILAAFVFVPSALAFDGRGDDKIVIAKDEVINDDLYLAGNEIMVEGTINGDLMATGEIVIISGKVTGDLFVAGNSVTVSGEVGDDLFAAGMAVTISPSAWIGDDVVAAGASVEARSGSQIDGDFLAAAGQVLASGAVDGDLKAGANRLRLEGVIGGDAIVRVGSMDDDFSTDFYRGPDVPAMPFVPGGLTFGPEAKVTGALEYTSPEKADIASTIVAQVTHKLPPMDQELSHEFARRNGPSSYIFNQIRRTVALLFIGLLIAWLAPRWITRTAELLKNRPLPSLGIGLVALVASPIMFVTATGVVIVTAIIFGALSMFNLTGLTLLAGFPLLGLVFVAFLFVVGYLCQSIVAYLVGHWILGKVRPEWNDKIYWPLLLGLLILALLFAVPIAGGFLQFLVVLVGLGALISLALQQPKMPVVAETL